VLHLPRPINPTASRLIEQPDADAEGSYSRFRLACAEIVHGSDTLLHRGRSELEGALLTDGRRRMLDAARRQ
jgi:hypothetical protein